MKSMNDFEDKIKYLGLKFGFYEPSNENEIIKTDDLIEVIHKIGNLIISKNNLFIRGDVGSGKTLIKNRAKSVFENLNTLVLPVQIFGQKIKFGNICGAVLLALDENIKLQWKHVDRISQLSSELEKYQNKPILILVDNCDKYNKIVLQEMIKFQKGKNFSIVFFGRLIELPNVETYALKGLSIIERKLFLNILHKKTKHILPKSIPDNYFYKTTSYFDIIYEFVDFTYKIKSGAIEY